MARKVGVFFSPRKPFVGGTICTYSEAGSFMDSTRHENIPVRIALSLRQQAEEIARKEGVSLNHFVTLALQEKIERMTDRQRLESSRREAAAG